MSAALVTGALACSDPALSSPSPRGHIEAVVVLTDLGLYRLAGAAFDAPRPLAEDELREGRASVKVTPIALVDLAEAPTKGKKPKPTPSPFELGNVFCGAPLAVFRGDVYAGGKRGGALWKVVPAPP
jgi:hypothetical protein